MPDDLGLSDRDRELAKWNKPYVFKAYPTMLYRCATVAGRLTQETRTVRSEAEAQTARGAGWLGDPQAATEAEEARQLALGTAAAERAWGDRRLSAAAQAEAAAVDATTVRHLGEIPETPVRRSHKKRRPAPAPTE